LYPEPGKPKKEARDTGGYAVALKFSMKYIYNVKKMRLLGSIDTGWVIATFLRTVIKPKYNYNFEGKPIKPDASTF
jgi:propionyl-CoA synthetase